MRRQPVAAAMRPAAVTPASEPSASPPRSSTPPGSAAAARAIASSSTRGRATRAVTSASPSASPHAQSAGTMSVATPPGGPRRGRDRIGEVPGQRLGAARRPHPARHGAREALDVRLQRRALPMCVVAWSPTMTTTGVRALAALWRLARPLASPARGAAGRARAGRPGARTRPRRPCRRPRTARGSGGPRSPRAPSPGPARWSRDSRSRCPVRLAAAVRSRASAPVSVLNPSARRRRGS